MIFAAPRSSTVNYNRTITDNNTANISAIDGRVATVESWKSEMANWRGTSTKTYDTLVAQVDNHEVLIAQNLTMFLECHESNGKIKAACVEGIDSDPVITYPLDGGIWIEAGGLMCVELPHMKPLESAECHTVDPRDGSELQTGSAWFYRHYPDTSDEDSLGG